MPVIRRLRPKPEPSSHLLSTKLHPYKHSRANAIRSTFRRRQSDEHMPAVAFETCNPFRTIQLPSPDDPTDDNEESNVVNDTFFHFPSPPRPVQTTATPSNTDFPTTSGPDIVNIHNNNEEDGPGIPGKDEVASNDSGVHTTSCLKTQHLPMTSSEAWAEQVETADDGFAGDVSAMSGFRIAGEDGSVEDQTSTLKEASPSAFFNTPLAKERTLRKAKLRKRCVQRELHAWRPNPERGSAVARKDLMHREQQHKVDIEAKIAVDGVDVRSVGLASVGVLALLTLMAPASMLHVVITAMMLALPLPALTPRWSLIIPLMIPTGARAKLEVVLYLAMMSWFSTLSMHPTSNEVDGRGEENPLS